MKMTTRDIGLLVLLLPLTVGVAVAEDAGRANEGKIELIDMYRVAENRPVNAGTVVGGLAGGLIGHQIGSGRGKTAATVAGAIGGAVVGNEIEKKQAQATRYRFTIRLDSGGTLIVEDAQDENLRVGDRVRVDGTHISRL
jgi:outer membrane lipoprotein SlyB